MKTLNLGTIKVPITAATKSFAVLAKRGAGKTYAAAVMAEEFGKGGIPFVVFDPIDVWWGLRVGADGKGKGLPVVVFGLHHADIPLTRDMGARIAEAVVRENISCVISTFGMPKVAQRQLIADFAETLLTINNTPRHVFIEEAHEFLPQRVFGAMGKVFAALEALVVMGRNRGIGVTLINQRAATINKDVLTQVDTLVALRNIAPQDRKALKEWVEKHAAEEHFTEFMDSLPSLPTGEAWFWSPEFLDIFKRIKIRKRETFHPDREKLGTSFKMPKFTQTDIAGFVEKFSKKPEVRPAQPKATPASPPAKITEAMLQEALHPHIVAIESERNAWNLLLDQYDEYDAGIMDIVNDMTLRLREHMKRKPSRKPTGVYVPPKAVRGGAVNRPVNPRHSLEIEPSGSDDGQKLGKCPAMIYSFLVKYEGRTFNKRQIGAATGYSIKSSGFENAISKLNTMGLIVKDGDGIKAGRLAPELAVYRDNDFSIRGWLSNLGRCPREIYSFLLEHPHDAYSKEYIAEATGYSLTSSGFENGLSALNSTGFIRKEGTMVRLNPELLDIN